MNVVSWQVKVVEGDCTLGALIHFMVEKRYSGRVIICLLLVSLIVLL